MNGLVRAAVFLCFDLCVSLPILGAQELEQPNPEQSLDPATQISPELKVEEAKEENNFFRYKDNYILGGNPDTKVQFSLKMRPIVGIDLYLAYTQMMFWKFTSQSRPFQDINFNPELFYEWERPQRFLRTLRFGNEHKSNGRAGEDSRSLDRAFVETGAQYGWNGYQILWDTRLFWIYDIDWQTNADIKQYTGFWYSRLTVDGIFKKIASGKAEAYVQFNPGGESGTKLRYGAWESGVKVRTRLFGVMPYLMIQYYYGYLESLLMYDHPTHSYRIGFVL